MKEIILTYHQVDSREFRQHLEYLRNKKNVLITFDDGYKSVYDNALPLLKEFKRSAIAFINPGLVGQEGRMDLSEINELGRSGIVIANHTWSHKPLAHLPAEEVKEEYEKAREWIRENIKTGAAPEVFALPKGSECSHTRAQLAALGAKRILGSERIDVYPGRSLKYFAYSIKPWFQWLRRNKKLAFIAALAVLVKLMLGVLLIAGVPNTGLPANYYIPAGGDDFSYVQQAEHIRQGDTLWGANPVGYPLYIRGVMAVSGQTELPGIALPLVTSNIFIFSTLALVLALFIVWHLRPKISSAIITAGTFLAFPYVWWFALGNFTLTTADGFVDQIGRMQGLHLFGLTVMSDWLAVPLVLGGLLAFVTTRYTWAGILMGLALSVRAQYLIPLILLCLVLIALKRWRGTIDYALGAILGGALQLVHNIVKAGSIFSFSAYTGPENASSRIDGIDLGNLLAVPARIIEHAPYLLPIIIVALIVLLAGLLKARNNFDRLTLLTVGILSPAALFLTAPALRNPRYFLAFIPALVALALLAYDLFRDKILARFNHLTVHKEFFRYGVSSIFTYGTLFGGMYLAVDVFGFHPTPSYVFVYGLNYLLVYISATKYVFKRDWSRQSAKRFLWHSIIFWTFGQLFFNVFLRSIDIHYLWIVALNSTVMAIIRFTSLRQYVFRDKV
ncbi:MAG TPA: polysaccharide deacetylase family protein [Candidatus Paceibacterota bacterium]